MARTQVACALVAWLLVVPGAGTPAARALDPEARRQQVLVAATGVQITIGEVEDVLAQQPAPLRARYTDRSQLEQLVDGMLRSQLLAREAERRGYAQNPAVRHTVKESAAQALVRLEVEDKLDPQSIPAEDVRAYYDAHPDEFHRGQTRRASYILLADAEQAARLLPEASKADARGFAELAKQHSIDLTTRPHGGDLGYFTREGEGVDAGEAKPPEPLREATFSLAEVGDTSQVITLDGQHAIVRLTGERPARHVSVGDAGPSIRAKLWRERRQQALDALFAKLRAREKPQVFTDRIYLISFDDMEKRPSGFAPDPVVPVARPAEAGMPQGR